MAGSTATLPSDAPAAGASATRFDLSPGERVKLPLIYLGIGLATVFGFVASFVVGRISVLLAGLGFVAYAFGLRHGVDADHIAAIDNTTRKLMQEGKRPLTVGLWFSLGHSTIVFALIVALVVATRAVTGNIPQLQSIGTVLGLLVSGTFLILIGLINVVIVVGIYGVFKELKRGHETMSQAELEDLLNKRGFMNRFLRPLFRIVREPWQVYPIGVLFGLGFDTASEVALIAISVGVGVTGAGVASSVPIWMILVLPLMFTCGMVLVDTTDGVTMRLAYGWAFINPIRKIYYNLTVTIVSVIVAFGIGGVEILQLVAQELKLGGPFWGWFAGLDFETLGFGIIGLFVLAWLVSVAYWRYKRYDKMFAPA